MPGATGTAQSLNTTRRFSPALTTTMPQRSQRSFSQSHLTHERLTVFPTPRQIRTKPSLQHIKRGGLISQSAPFYRDLPLFSPFTIYRIFPITALLFAHDLFS